MKRKFTQFIDDAGDTRHYFVGIILLFLLLLIAHVAGAQTITTISPQCGIRNQNFQMIIDGNGFSTSGANAAFVKINGNTINPISVTANRIVINVAASDIPAIGVYSIVVSQDKGSTNSSPKNLIILGPPTVSNVTRCGPGSVTLNASGAPAGAAYQWYDPSGTAIPNATASTYNTPTINGNTTYSVAMTAPDACISARTNLIVTVNPLPVVTAADKQVCFGNNSVPLTGSPAGGTWSGTGVSGSTFSANGLAAGNYTVTYTYKDGNNCTNSATATVTVNPLPVVTAADKQVCFGNNSVPLTGSPAGGTWSGTGVSGSTFSANGLAAGNYTVTYTYKDGNNCTNSATATVTVNPLPVVTAADKQVCFGNNSVPLTGSPAGGTWSGTGVSGSTFSANGLAAGNYTVTYTYKDGNNCTNSATATVTVNPLPVVTAADKQVCFGNNSVPLTGSPAGGTWSGTGVSGSTFSANGLAAGNYTVTYTYKDGNNCTNSATATVTVNPLPDATTIAGGPTTFCSGSSVELSAPLDQNYSYKWFNGSTEVGTGQTYTASNSGDYKVQVTNTVTGCTSTTATAITVTVLPQPVASITSGSEAKCIGANNTTTFTVSGDFSGGTAQWISSNASFQIQNPDYNTGTGKATATVVATGSGAATITLQTSNATPACNTATSQVTLTVNPLPVATITAEGDTEFCQGGSVKLTANGGTSWLWSNGATTQSIVVNASGSFTVQVTDANTCTSAPSDQVDVIVNPLPSTTITPTGPTKFCQGNSVILNGPAQPTNQEYYYQWLNDGVVMADSTNQSIEVDVSGNYSLRVTTGKGCISTSAPIVVKVQTQVAATITYTGALEFCDGGSVLFRAPVPPAGQQYTYKWFKDANTTPISTDASYIATSSGSYSVEVSNVNDDPDLVCHKLSDAITVTVLPQPAASITSGSEAKCIGANNTTTFTVSGDFSGGTAQWISSNASFQIQNPVYNTGTGKATATVVATGSGAATITLQTSNATPACNTATSQVTLTVNPLPVATITAEGATEFCQGGSVKLSAPAGPYSYQWFKNSGAIAAPEGTAREYTASTAGNYTVRVTNTTTGCVATTTTATVVTVNPQPVVSAASAAPAAQCVGTGSTTIFDLSGAVANGTPKWTVVGTTGGASVSNISSPNTTATQVTVSGVGTVTMRLTASSSVASCTDAFKDVTLTVHPYPTADAGPDMELCVGNNLTRFNRQASGSGSEGANQVAWTVKSTSPGVKVSNLAYPFQYNNFVDVTGIGTAVLTLTVTTNGCSTSDDVVFTVKPRPDLAVVENKVFCNGETGAAISFSGSLPGSTFSWTSNRDIGFGTMGDGNIPSFTATNTGTAPVVATINVTATANGCPGPQLAFTITVNPSPKLSSTLTPPAICSGNLFSYTPTSATTNATFSWTRASVPGISNAPVTTPVAGGVSETLVNITADPIKVIYVFTTTANNCSGTPQNVEVIVNPRPQLSSTLAPAPICSGTAFTYTPTSATTGATFTWQRLAAPGINGGASVNGSGPINQVLTNSTTDPVDVTYRFTTSANTCNGLNTQDVVVRVNPTPALSSTLTPAAVCSGTLFNYTPISATAGATFTWTRAAVTGISNAPVTTPVSGSINETLINTTANPINVTYKYTTTANGCASAVQNVVVKVNPTPTLTSSLTPAAVCSETTFTYNPISATTGTAFTWTRAAVSGVSNPAVTAPVAGSVSEVLINTTTTDKTVTYIYTLSANGCTNTQNVVVTVKPKPQPNITNVVEGQVFYSGAGNYTLTASPSGGTFSGTGVSGSVFNPCNIFNSEPATVKEKTVAITYTVTVNGCTSSVTRNVKVKRSIYRIIVTAEPHPFCQGINVHYTSYVYRDADVVYPYLVNEKGEPVDNAGNLIPKGSSSFPVWNPDYPFPAGTPQLIKEQGYRYFQPIVRSGTPLNKDLFTYQWTKNEKVDRKNDLFETDDAGLSSQDYYGVKVTSKSGVLCDAALTDLMSYRMYSADLPDYEVRLDVLPNPICTSGPVTLTATLNGNFAYWSIAGLKLQFILTRGSTTYSLGTYDYNGTNTIQFTYDPASIGGFIDGDKIQVNFTSVVDDAVKGTKCAGKFNSNVVTIKVDQPAAISTNLTAPAATCEGQSATFSISGTGTDLVFKWYKVLNGTTTQVLAGGKYTITSTVSGGVTTSTLTISNVATSDGATYFANVANNTTSVCVSALNSNEVVLVVNTLPTIAVQPQPARLCVGASKTFSVTASGTGLQYQWYKTGTLIPGATGSSYTIPSVAVSDQGDYTVRITGTCAVITSAVASLVVDQPANITANLPSAGQTVCVGGTATYTVNATGTDLQFSWFKAGGVPVTNGGRFTIQTTASGSTLTITNAASGDAGNYYVTVSNSAATACSNPVKSFEVPLVVNPLPVTRTILSKPYCPISEPNGATISVENSESGVTYSLSQNGTVLATLAGDGTTKAFQGTYKEGTYTVSATNTSTTCGNSSVGQTTVTVTDVPVVTGELQITWINNKTQWEIVALSDYADKSDLVYSWYIGAGATEPTLVTSTNTIVIDNTDPELYVKCLITSSLGRCVPDLELNSEEVVPLPVEIIYLTAEKQGSDVLLKWATAMEKDNTGFEVQVSNDGDNFRKITFVPTRNGNSSMKQLYEYKDIENGKHGTRYYRLKQLDASGTFEYFGPKVVEFGSVSDNIKVYPNPFLNEVNLSIEAEQDGEVEIVFSNAVGRQIIKTTVQVEKGLNTEQILLDMTLPRGVYFITTRMGSVTNHFKLLKQ